MWTRVPAPADGLDGCYPLPADGARCPSAVVRRWGLAAHPYLAGMARGLPRPLVDGGETSPGRVAHSDAGGMRTVRTGAGEVRSTFSATLPRR